jgi:hypothetical protein
MMKSDDTSSIHNEDLEGPGMMWCLEASSGVWSRLDCLHITLIYCTFGQIIYNLVNLN